MKPTSKLWVTLAMSIVAGTGCNAEEPSTVRRAPPDAIPPLTPISADEVVLGVSLGKLRTAAAVKAFEITTAPVTVRQYGLCMKAGACASASWDVVQCQEVPGSGVDGPTIDQGVDDAPLTCASPQQASEYCSWLGGRLPTVAEWLLAVRGKTPTRFAWGDDPVDCERHWRLSWTALDERCCGVECTATAAVVGKHPKGQSPLGLADVLSTSAELIGKGGPSYVPCSTAGCMVTGLDPGAIDRFLPLGEFLESGSQEAVNAEFRRLARPASFRCVLENSR